MLGEEKYVVDMWTETSRGLNPTAHSYDYSGQRSPESWEASTIEYDPTEELLWVGYSSGFLCSFHSAEHGEGILECYTSRKIAENRVKCVLPCTLGILAVHAKGIQLFSRGLISKAKYLCGSLEQEDSGKGGSSGSSKRGGKEAEFSCAAFNAPFMAMTNGGDSMSHVTLGRGNVLDQLDIHSCLRKSTSVTMPNGSISKSMACGAMLAVGSEDGRVMMYDATLRHKNPQGVVVAHDGPVGSIACSPGDGYLVITVGQSAKSLNPYDKNAPCTYSCDPAIQVFDVRMMAARVPLCFPGFLTDPFAVTFNPGGTLAVGGHSGHMVLRSSSDYGVDLPGGDTSEEFHVVFDVSTGIPDGITGIAASSSGACLAVSCVSGSVVQFTSAPSVQTGDIFVNHKSVPTVFPEFPPPRAPVSVPPYDPSPFGSKYIIRQTMEQFYSTGPLSSSMANTPWIISQFLQHAPARQISSSITSVVKERGGIKTAAMPTPPYPPNSLIYGIGKSLYAQCDPRHSDTATCTMPSSSAALSSSANHGDGRKGTTEYDVPNRYRKMRTSLSRKSHFKRIDFSTYNSTSFAGLQNDMPNAYMNIIIQLLYFVDPLKLALLKEQFNMRHTHPSTLPASTDGLACGFGMLYHQFQLIQILISHPDYNSKKKNALVKCIPSSNVVRHIKQMPEACALGLLEDAPSQGPVPPSLPQRLETFHRFLLTELNRDLARASPIDSLYGYTVRSVNTAAQHVNAAAEGEGEGRFTRAFVAELATTQDLQSNTSPSPSTTTTSGTCFFSDLLWKTLCRQSRTRAWSPQLSEFVPVRQKRTAETLPKFLTLHCGGAVQSPPTLALFRGKNARGGPWLPEAITVDVWQTAARESHLIVRERLDLPHGWVSNIISDKEDGDEKLPAGVYRDSMTGDLWYQSKMESESTAENLQGQQLQYCGADSQEKGKENKTYQTRKYLLHAVVSRIHRAASNGSSPSTDCDSEEEHAVLHVRLVQSQEEDSDGVLGRDIKHGDNNVWLIVNGILTEYTVLEDAISFQIPWKDPCILLYRCCEAGEEGNKAIETPCIVAENDTGNQEGIIISSSSQITDCGVLPPSYGRISSSIFGIPSLGLSRSVFDCTPRSLPHDLPEKGDIVAIDTEYLALSVEESELDEDGTRRVSRCARMSPARMSIVNGRNNSVLVDDFIVQTEPVVDYLTRFSGIKPEDLDPSTSQHHLSSIRTSCLKLRYLIDAGCTFVGHDLSNDFGVLNVTVPPDQIQDTVWLWRSPRKRKMSLRFLAHYVLTQDIQGETHDSVEDAKVALALYLYHKKCKRNGTLQKTLNRLYEYGNRVDFKARCSPGQ